MSPLLLKENNNKTNKTKTDKVCGRSRWKQASLMIRNDTQSFFLSVQVFKDNVAYHLVTPKAPGLNEKVLNIVLVCFPQVVREKPTEYVMALHFVPNETGHVVCAQRLCGFCCHYRPDQTGHVVCARRLCGFCCHFKPRQHVHTILLTLQYSKDSALIFSLVQIQRRTRTVCMLSRFCPTELYTMMDEVTTRNTQVFISPLL